MTRKNASHAESSHTRSAPRKHDREKTEREKMSPIFFQMSGLSSYPLRHFDLSLRIMSIIVRSYTPSFLGMIPQKLLTNLEESPWNLSENLRKVLVLLPVFVQSSCGHASIVIPATKLEAKFNTKGTQSIWKSYLYFMNQMPNNFNSLEDFGCKIINLKK